MTSGSIKVFFLISFLIPAAMACGSSTDSAAALPGAEELAQRVTIPSLDEIPDLYARFTAVGLEFPGDTKRNLFLLESPEAIEVKGGGAPTPEPVPPRIVPVPPISGAAAEECDPDVRFLGYFGYPDQRIGVFAREGSWEPILACEGDFMEIGFRLAEMGYDSATLTAGCLELPLNIPLAGGRK